VGADIRDADATLLAVEGSDVVYDCIGLSGDQMHLRPVIARNIAGAFHHSLLLTPNGLLLTPNGLLLTPNEHYAMSEFSPLWRR